MKTFSPGYTEKTLPVRWAGGPLFTVPAAQSGQILMRFRGGGQNILSGLMKGSPEIRNRPAIVNVPTAPAGATPA